MGCDIENIFGSIVKAIEGVFSWVINKVVALVTAVFNLLIDLILSLPPFVWLAQQYHRFMAYYDGCQDYQRFEGGWLNFPQLWDALCVVQMVKAVLLILAMALLVALGIYFSILGYSMLGEAYSKGKDYCKCCWCCCQIGLVSVPEGQFEASVVEEKAERQAQLEEKYSDYLQDGILQLN